MQFSPEKVVVYPGAEVLLDREIAVSDYKNLLRAKRKDLKSATA
jgi:hypothetical protein